MATILKLIPIILLWESPKYVNNPGDHGGPTKFGVTLGTWQSCGYDKNHDGHIDALDVQLLTPEDYQFVLKSYWNTWKADQINNQSIANILVDWVWGSGKWGVVIPQRLLNLDDDGVVGPNTLGAVNSSDQEDLFNKIHDARIHFANDICDKHPDQEKWRHGWINRINSFKFQA